MVEKIDVVDGFMMMAERAFKQRDEMAKALADVLEKHGGLGVSPEIVRAKAVLAAVVGTVGAKP